MEIKRRDFQIATCNLVKFSTILEINFIIISFLFIYLFVSWAVPRDKLQAYF